MQCYGIRAITFTVAITGIKLVYPSYSALAMCHSISSNHLVVRLGQSVDIRKITHLAGVLLG